MLGRKRASRWVAAVVAAVAGSLALQAQPTSPLRETEVLGRSIAAPRGEGFASMPADLLGGLMLDSAVNGEVGAAPMPGPAADVAIAPPPAVFDAPAPAPAPVPALQRPFAEVKPEGGTWAVIIGINDYPGRSSDLRSAVADANDTDAALARLGVPASNRLMLHDREATAGTIRAAADWLVAHAGPDAVAVFAYAGHVRKLREGREAIVAADGALVTDVDLARHLARLQARRTWVMMAACYSGGFTEVLGPGRVLTAAAGANQLAYENLDYGRSYLAEYMVRRAILHGAADQNVEAAFAWARAQLQRDHPNRVPLQYDHADGDVDLRPPGAQTTAAAPPPSGDSSGSGSSSSGGSGDSTGSDDGGSSDGGSGGGSGGDSGSPPPPSDGCARLTFGVVRCSDGD